MKSNYHHRSFWISLLGLVLFSCSTDSDGDEPLEEVPVNARPLIENQSFEVLETIGGFIEIGQIEAVDPEGGALKYFIESDYPLAVNLNTGVLSTVDKNVFDYETTTSIQATITVRDAESATASATITINVLNVEDGPLTDAQKEFVEEYIYLTYKLSPTASGGTLSEKWQGVLNVYIEGVSDSYLNTLNSFLDEYRGFITDGTAIQLVNTAEDANVHVIFGPTEAVREVWPDMYEFIKGNQFGGYALYNSTFDNYIYRGRIWMGYEDEGLFKHEFGHIIGLGHTSDQYCADEVTSVMCSGAAQQFNPFDREIIKTLYHPDTPVGLTTLQMRTHVESFIVANGVEL